MPSTLFDMSSWSDRLNSPRFVRRVSWGAGLVFIAGVVAFTVTYFGSDSSKEQAPVANGPRIVEENQPTVPLETSARRVAGEFILTAVQRDVPRAQLRKNMAKAWKITAPGSDVRFCGDHQCTYAEWLTGNVAIQTYPSDAIDKASFSVEESHPNSVYLEVALLPKDGAGVEGQIFKIGLKAVGMGKNKRWLVEYWAPRAINQVPVAE
jgi:hypothetical protein